MIAAYEAVKRRGTKEDMRKAFPAMCETIGAPRNTPYSGRRTFISSLVDANVNIKTIRNYVGH